MNYFKIFYAFLFFNLFINDSSYVHGLERVNHHNNHTKGTNTPTKGTSTLARHGKILQFTSLRRKKHLGVFLNNKKYLCKLLDK